jgi:NADH:ubiquinone oxidoreductase subunit C
MSVETALQQAEELCRQWVVETLRPEAHRVDLVVDKADFLAAVKALHEAGWGYFSGITGLDYGEEANRFEVLYHFYHGRAVTSLRLRIPRDLAEVPSICSIIPSATFFERELMEMFGITVVGTPNPERLFLPDSWPQGVYPLRKEFEAKEIEV